jgi:hypothetical protein
MREAGFESAGQGQGVNYPETDMPPSQQAIKNQAIFECDMAYPLHPGYTRAFSDEQLGLLYDYFVEWYVPCVTGLDVTVSLPPTKESWMASAKASSNDLWYPPNEAEMAYAWTYEKRVNLARTCPVEPSMAIWGEEG